MERIIMLGNQLPETSLVGEVAGTYTAQMGGTDCVFKLWFNQAGYVHGSFEVEGESLEIRGAVSSRSGAVFGFFLDAIGETPVAMFRARPSVAGLSLQVDVPDFDELMDLCNPETITLSKVFDHSDFRHAAD